MTEEGPRIIKKYPNRRLYDTAVSSYITLEDVKRLVLEGICLKVIDARSQADITHATLLQIITEQEDKGPPLFTTEMLSEFIRFYGSSMQEMMSRILSQGMLLFKQHEEVFKRSWDGWEKILPPETSGGLFNLQEFTQQNLSIWESMQKDWLSFMQKNVVPPTTKDRSSVTQTEAYPEESSIKS